MYMSVREIVLCQENENGRDVYIDASMHSSLSVTDIMQDWPIMAEHCQETEKGSGVAIYSCTCSTCSICTCKVISL